MVGTVGIEPTMLPYRNRFTVYRDTTSSHLIPKMVLSVGFEPTLYDLKERYFTIKLRQHV